MRLDSFRLFGRTPFSFSRSSQKSSIRDGYATQEATHDAAVKEHRLALGERQRLARLVVHDRAHRARPPVCSEKGQVSVHSVNLQFSHYNQQHDLSWRQRQTQFGCFVRAFFLVPTAAVSAATRTWLHVLDVVAREPAGCSVQRALPPATLDDLRHRDDVPP